MATFISPSADVAGSASIGDGSSIWHLAQIEGGAVLGTSCIVGRGAYVGPDVHIGDNVKIQNYALVYAPAELQSGVFVGPAVVLTNDLNPRAGGRQWEAQAKRKLDARWCPGKGGRIARGTRRLHCPADHWALGDGWCRSGRRQ